MKNVTKNLNDSAPGSEPFRPEVKELIPRREFVSDDLSPEGLAKLADRVRKNPGLIDHMGLIDPSRFRKDLSDYRRMGGLAEGNYFIVWGLPGVGKSHTLRGVKDSDPALADKVVMVNVGDSMWALVGPERPEISRKDEMRSKLTPEDTAEYRQRALKAIKERFGEMKGVFFFLDTHALIDTFDERLGAPRMDEYGNMNHHPPRFYELGRPRFNPGVTPEVIGALGRPKGAIILEEAPWKIIKNRLKDAGERTRHTHEPLISEQQMLNRAFAALVAEAVGMPLAVIPDSNLKEPEAIRTIVDFIRKPPAPITLT
jgi:adenylate kinase